MTNLELLIENIADYAKDIKINAKSVILGESGPLTKNQTALIAISCAIVTKNEKLSNAVKDYFANVINNVELEAAKSVSAIMSMNNIYYRFLHLCDNKNYHKVPANLRMGVINSHGIEKNDFELASIAVSAINGCGLCIDSHEKVLKKHQVSEQQIQQAIKIAAVTNALSVVC